MGIIGAVAFVVALLLSVMVHEFGHYITAKRYGMHVTEFFLGFGRRIWSTVRGETEFGLKAIPAGGYCKISGMSPREPISPEIEPRAFYKASAPRRLVVLGAGSFLHFVLGFLLLFVLFAGVGTSKVLSTVSEVVPCVTTKSACSSSDPISPAKQAGIQPGDVITGINGKTNLNWEEITTVLRSSPNTSVTLIIDRSGQTLELPVTLSSREVEGKVRGFLGVVNRVGLVRESPVSAITESVSSFNQLFSGSIRSLVGLPAQIPSLFRQTFLGEARSQDGLVGIVGVARATSEAASSGNLTGGEKLATFILIIASLNIFVGIFNLIPILPLDGGHMAIAIVDGVRRTTARRRGRPEPEPVDVERLTPITFVVVALLIFLTLLLLLADIFNPINLRL